MPESRSQQLASVAFDLGLAFFPKDEWGLLHLLEDFKLFKRGFGKKITNIFRSQDDFLDTSLRMFDYQYTINAGKTSRRFRQSVFFADSRKLGLPDFRMKPETFIHRIGALLGFEDIDFPDFPEFSRQYYLISSDEHFLRATMHDGILQFFSIEKGWRVEGINYYLIFYRHNELLPPEQVRKFYNKGIRVFDLFKEEQEKDQGKQKRSNTNRKGRNNRKSRR